MLESVKPARGAAVLAATETSVHHSAFVAYGCVRHAVGVGFTFPSFGGIVFRILVFHIAIAAFGQFAGIGAGVVIGRVAVVAFFRSGLLAIATLLLNFAGIAAPVAVGIVPVITLLFSAAIRRTTFERFVGITLVVATASNGLGSIPLTTIVTRTASNT